MFYEEENPAQDDEEEDDDEEPDFNDVNEDSDDIVPFEKKKKDIDLATIKGLYYDEVEKIRKAYIFKDDGLTPRFPPSNWEAIEVLRGTKNKFIELKDKYNFNEYNESVFLNKTKKLLDFEEKIRSDVNDPELLFMIGKVNDMIEDINKKIVELKNDNFERFFNSDPDL